MARVGGTAGAEALAYRGNGCKAGTLHAVRIKQLK